MPATENVPNPAGYTGRVVTHPPDWHAHVVLDLLFNNLATGLFLAAAACELAAPTAFGRVTTWAYPLALGLLLIDLVLLVLDLGDPFRFHHMLRVFKPTSPMSLGTWFLTVYSLFPTTLVAVEVIVAVGWLPTDSSLVWLVRKVAVAGGLPFAFGSAAYKGVLFSVTAQPGWKHARWFGAYLINSAVMLGATQLLVMAELLGEQSATSILRPAVGVLAALNLLPLAALANNLGPTLASVYPRRERVAFGVVTVAGVIFVVGLLAVGGLVAALVVLAIMVATCFAVRDTLIDLPHRAVRLAR
jgi:hypothetical protein